jgi:uncharacterized membrane protein (DUF2068 family)
MDFMLRAIAIFKFAKAALLIALSFGAFQMMNKDIGAEAERWVRAMRLDPGNRYVDTALTKASLLNTTQIKHLGMGGLFYAALFLTEGTGLWMRKRWAEWMTVILTSTLVPVEIYEIWRHPTAVKVLVLLINIGIVIYLILQIRRERAQS